MLELISRPLEKRSGLFEFSSLNLSKLIFFLNNNFWFMIFSNNYKLNLRLRTERKYYEKQNQFTINNLINKNKQASRVETVIRGRKQKDKTIC